MFDLPAKLNEFVESDEKLSPRRAITYYLKARRTLDHYKHMPTFKNIDDDCTAIIGELKSKLYARILSASSDTAGTSADTDVDVAESVLESIRSVGLGETALAATLFRRSY